ncbi:Gfo/Idh/MocA family protein [Halobacillus sp. A5]|uniref:Gfo/Idh/MocA family protein n=1 Tax=Halobacillus sp. A5 TaxID=2880263 RepID=UPI0020A6376E|nr:Gfo/Idh/MocA family oxidoreductase [Halobacillus sp. A5]MCP3028575.1 Gfo/Idh/MocA family oxidoreductase [Halobacillus sp. A5]
MKIHKIIVAGCGTMAHTWLDYASQRNNAEVAGVVDVNAAAAKELAESHSLQVPVFTNLADALEQTDASLVFDVTVPAAHKQVVTTALKGGCHVFGEKPIAETLKDASEVVKTAQKTGKNYFVMQNRRYQKEIRAFKYLLDSRVIGRIGSIHADFFLGPHFGGFREAMKSPLIMDMAIHTFDQARFITGADAVSVYCHEYNPPGSWYEGDSSAVCIFEMSDGSIFTYRGSWSAVGHSTSWEADWRVMGSKGSVRWNGSDDPACEIIDESRPQGFMDSVKVVEEENAWSGREGHFGCLDEMFAALEEARPAETDCRDNFKSMEMVFKAMESARSGKKITF